MKKGISQLVLPRDKSLKEHLEFARSAGYEGIELSFRIEELHLDMKESELEAVREMCLEHGLIPCSACGVSAPLTSPDRDEREKGKENVIKLLRCAKALGIDAVLVVPGRVTESVPYDAAYENCLRSLMELAPVAEEIKVSIAIENVWNRFLLSPLEMRMLLDTVDSPYVGMYFDVGNVVIFGYPEQWIRIVGSKIRKVHVKDFRRKGYQWTPLMEGDVDWKAVMSELRAIGYDDFLISEVGGDEEAHRRTAETMDRIISLRS